LIELPDTPLLQQFQAEAGRMEPGSVVGMVAAELRDPARGTLRLLSKADLETIVEDFRSLAKYATELAKEK